MEKSATSTGLKNLRDFFVAKESKYRFKQPKFTD